MKTLLTLLLAAIGAVLSTHAQDARLIRALTPDDLRALDVQVRDCFSLNVNVSFSIKTTNFENPEKIIPEQPSSIKQVKELEKQLKGGYTDAVIFNNIGKIYERLQQPEKAASCFAKALAIAEKYISNHPDSVNAHTTVAAIYVNQGKLDQAIAAYRKAVALNPADSLSQLMIPFCNMFAGNTREALKDIDSILVKKPTSVFYHNLRLLNVYLDKITLFRQNDAATIANRIRGKKPGEIIDLSLTQAACAAQPRQHDFSLLCSVSVHLGLYLKSVFLTMADTSIAPGNFSFVLENADRQLLDELELFYRNYLKNNHPATNYLAHKALANILLMKGATRAAVPLLEKTIALKPLKQSTFDDNASEDYDNLAAAHLLLKDTATYIKIINSKLKLQPAVNPLATDYMNVAKAAFYQKNLMGAEKYAAQAVKLDAALRADALVCRTAIHLLQRKPGPALQLVDSLYALDPGRAELYILMGIAALQNNDAATAYSAFQKAKTLYPKNDWINEQLINPYLTLTSRR